MLVSSLVVFELEFVKWIEPLVFHCLCHLCFCFVKWLWNVKCWSGFDGSSLRDIVSLDS